MSNWHARILRDELQRNACNIKELARILATSESYPTKTATVLCDLIALAAEAVEKHVGTAKDDQLPYANKFLCTITEHLRYAERARTPQTPWSMVEASESLLRKYVGEDARFILRAQWSYNYKIAGNLIQTYRDMLEELDWIPLDSWKTINAHPTRIYCISFPRIERLNALLHSNWGHEVGHIVAQHWVQDKFAAFWKPIESSLREQLKLDMRPRGKNAKGTDKQLDMILEDQRVAKKLNETMQIVRRGVIELIADAVGAYVLGPAAIVAAAEVASRFGLDREPLESTALYPSWRYRLKKLFGYCEDDLKRVADHSASDVANRLSAFLVWLAEVKLTANDTVSASVDARVVAAYAAIEAEWDRIRLEALAELPGFPSGAYQLSSRLEQVVDLVAKLADEIPPNEFGNWPRTRPAPIEDILVAGCIQKANIRAASNSKLDDIMVLNRLILRGIETSRVHQMFGPRLDALEKSK